MFNDGGLLTTSPRYGATKGERFISVCVGHKTKPPPANPPFRTYTFFVCSIDFFSLLPTYEP